MNKIADLKKQLKALAADIRALRAAHKNFARSGFEKWTGPKEHFSLDLTVHFYRHAHIAYCLLRGRQYEQIEPKVLPGNEPNWKLIDSIREQGVPGIGIPESKSIAHYGPDLKMYCYKSEGNRELWDENFAMLKKLERETTEMERATKEAASMMDQFVKNFWKLLA